MTAHVDSLDFHIGSVDFKLRTTGWDGEGRLYEPDVMRAILTFVKPGDVCVDAGANLGYHTMLLSKLVGSGGRVVAFEPDPTHFEHLCANVELNGCDNVELSPIALWSVDLPKGKELFTIEGGGYSSFASAFGNSSVRPVIVSVMALDNALISDVPIRLLKIDCEGSEEQILYGAEKLLTRGVNCIVVEFNFEIMDYFGMSDRRVRRYMDSLGYDFFILSETDEPVLLAPGPTIDLSGDRWWINGMFVRRNR